MASYDVWASAIRKIVSLAPAHGGRSKRIDAHVAAEVSRLLAKVESRLADQLCASGVGPDAAAQSALSFVAQTAERFRAHRAPDAR